MTWYLQKESALISSMPSNSSSWLSRHEGYWNAITYALATRCVFFFVFQFFFYLFPQCFLHTHQSRTQCNNITSWGRIDVTQCIKSCTILLLSFHSSYLTYSCFFIFILSVSLQSSSSSSTHSFLLSKSFDVNNQNIDLNERFINKINLFFL